MKTFTDKVKALFCGPGWFPGTPRTGNLSDIPEVKNYYYYAVKENSNYSFL